VPSLQKAKDENAYRSEGASARFAPCFIHLLISCWVRYWGFLYWLLYREFQFVSY